MKYLFDKQHILFVLFINEFNNYFYLHRHDDIGCELISVYNILKFVNQNNSNSFELNTLCNHLQSFVHYLKFERDILTGSS